ncbi:hypothetical protein PROFUN_15475 [Planoprotostelium fungivorum]|uniref:Uncharacterized protein n=1 Tax=Planoprotostelium fungivorum TaxID=1890364 RepID=A0A2P6MUL2_9EUKA|nr:hypothetical protein PROFUN_15475 [Planoprotostelium fungivorum]
MQLRMNYVPDKTYAQLNSQLLKSTVIYMFELFWCTTYDKKGHNFPMTYAKNTENTPELSCLCTRSE